MKNRINYLQCLIISFMIFWILGTLKKNIVWIDFMYLFTIFIRSSKSSVLPSDSFSLWNVVSMTSDCKYFHSCEITILILALNTEILLSNISNWVLDDFELTFSCFILLGIAFHIYYNWIWVCLMGNKNLWAREKLSNKSWVRTKSNGQEVL